jgi:RNA polymerase sigma-70 factor (ECF subfamily)
MTGMDAEHGQTLDLLRAWHAGDRGALADLLARELPWIREQVRPRLGPLLRARAESQDYVQEALIRVLEYGPRFVAADRQRFRGLLLRIIENQLRDMVDWHGAEKRGVRLERPLPSDSVIDVDSRRAVTRPSEHAIASERRAWLHLALELLDPEDRRVILLRQWHELEFAAIAELLGVTADAARMRFNRALPQLARKLEDLLAGRELPTDAAR